MRSAGSESESWGGKNAEGHERSQPAQTFELSSLRPEYLK